jgi:lipase ATG15
MFGAEVVLLFIFPLVSLFLTGDSAIGIIFLVIGIFSLSRYYMNAGVVLEEVGSLHALLGKDDHRKWQNRSRTNDIVTNITRSRSRGPWIIVLGFFFFLCLALVISGMTQSDSQALQSGIDATLIPGFVYVREENTLPYPTCSLDFNSGGPTGGVVNTIDFAFMAAMAYETNATRLQEFYDEWFGPGVAMNMPDVVSDFRNQTQRETSPVTYSLASFPNFTSTGDPIGVVSIRGSQNSWDWLTNAQLWSAALGMQFLQSFLPFGFVWHPIMDELVKGISIVESESIRRVSYYVETTDFVQWLQGNGEFGDIKVTGHSLGGGLAIITGAQTGASGVAISGPNAMLSRKAFDPPISEEALNTFTFNVIPDRDVVPRVGGVAHLFENVDCTAPARDVFGCHTSTRTLCELLYKCGSGNRPPLCQCVTEFGYPEPISTSGELFAEACAI